MIVLVLKIGQFSINFEHKIDHNSKNKNYKNRKIDFQLIAHLSWSIFFMAGDTLENPSVPPASYKYISHN